MGVVFTLIAQHKVIRDFFLIKADFSYQDNFRDGGRALQSSSGKVEGSPVFTNQGIALAAGDRFRLVYKFTKPPKADIQIKLGFPAGEYLSNQVIIQSSRGTRSVKNTNFQPNNMLSIQKELDGDAEFSVILESSASPEAKGQQKALDLVSIVVKEREIPPVNEIFYAWACSISIYFLLKLLSWKEKHGIILAGVVFILLQAKVGFLRVEPFCLFWPALMGTCLCWHVSFFRKTDPERRFASLVTLLLIMGLALDYRMEALMVYKNTPLPADGTTYFTIAKWGGNLYNTEFREPVFIWLLRLYYLFVPQRPENLRILTMLLSLVSLPVLYVLAANMTNRAIALCAVLFMATNQNFIYQNLRGLRLELLVITLILAMHLFLDKGGVKTWARGILLGLLIAASSLNTLGLGAPLIILMVYFFIRKKLTLKCLLVSLAILLILSLPHFVHNRKKFGDPFYSSNIHARFYRNVEFMGKPGFPTAEEVQSNGYCGPRITTAQYIFNLHTRDVVFLRMIGGFVSTCFTDTLQQRFLDNSKLLFWFYILGLILCAVRRRWDFLFSLFILNLPFYFLNGTPEINFDFRLLLHTQPLVAIILAAGIIEGSRAVLNTGTHGRR